MMTEFSSSGERFLLGTLYKKRYNECNVIGYLDLDRYHLQITSLVFIMIKIILLTPNKNNKILHYIPVKKHTDHSIK